ncbi:MAG: hypothetical protein AB1486_05175 [Planctomycetota bacterium]
MTPIAARKLGWAPWKGEVAVVAGTTARVSINLEAGAVLSGVVTDSRGAPLSAVTMGRFVFANCVAGPYDSSIDEPPFDLVCCETLSGVRAGAPEVIIRIPQEKRCSVFFEGVVADPAGNPIDSAVVEVVSGDPYNARQHAAGATGTKEPGRLLGRRTVGWT